MQINLTLGPKSSKDTTDIQRIEEKNDSILVHWKAYPGGAHVYTDIQKQTLVNWYEEYGGGTPGPTPEGFEELLAEFQSLMPGTIKKDSKTWKYLVAAYNMAENEWEDADGLFDPSYYPEIYQYRGANTTYQETAHTAMLAWLMAMCLVELAPNEGDYTNRQTQLYQKAYTLGGGRSIPLYGEYFYKGDVMAARLVAGAIYAKNRAAYTFDDMDAMRNEIGGNVYSDSTYSWTELGYEGSEANPISHLGYAVNLNTIFPSAPGPFMNTQSRSHPSEQSASLFYTGQESGAENWWKDNYKVDVAIDNEVISHYNLTSSDIDFARTVQAVSDDSETIYHFFAEKTYYKYTEGTYGRRFTFYAGSSGDNDPYFKGTFCSDVTGVDLSSLLTNNDSGYDIDVTKRGKEKVLASVTSFGYFAAGADYVGSKGRKPLLDSQYGRRRPSEGEANNSPRVASPGDYRYNWLLDYSIERLVGSGTKYDESGTPQRWVDISGDGSYDQGEPIVGESAGSYSGDIQSQLYSNQAATTYPSGHSSGVWSLALFMIQFFPNRYKEIFKAAYAFSVSRTIVRAHWNSDITYGRVIGTMVVPIVNARTMFLPVGKTTPMNFRDIYKNAYDQAMGGGGGGDVPVGDTNINIKLINTSSEDIYITGHIYIAVITADDSDWGPLNIDFKAGVQKGNVTLRGVTHNSADYLLKAGKTATFTQNLLNVTVKSSNPDEVPSKYYGGKVFRFPPTDPNHPNEPVYWRVYSWTTAHDPAVVKSQPQTTGKIPFYKGCTIVFILTRTDQEKEGRITHPEESAAVNIAD